MTGIEMADLWQDFRTAHYHISKSAQYFIKFSNSHNNDKFSYFFAS
jgi:hypothetical protein